MATVSTETNKPNQPPQGPAPGQRPQTTSEPGRSTVAQKEPEKAPENPAAKSATGSKDPVTSAKSQEDLDKAAVESHNAPSPKSEKSTDSSVRQKTVTEVNDELDKLVEKITEDLQSIAGDGNPITDITSQLVARLRRGAKGVGAAPLRHTSGGSPLDAFDKARAEGKAPVQGSF